MGEIDELSLETFCSPGHERTITMFYQSKTYVKPYIKLIQAKAYIQT